MGNKLLPGCITVLFLLSLSLTLSAGEKDDFGIWQSVLVGKSFSDRVSASMWFEHRSRNMASDLDCADIMPTVTFKATDWLGFEMSSEYVMCPDDLRQITLRPSVILSVKSGAVSLSLREMAYMEHNFGEHGCDWTLRTRVKASWKVPSSPFKPYASCEVFTAGHFKKSRNYLGTEWRFGRHSGLDLFYMYYIMAGKEWQRHVLGVGYFLDI